MAKILSFPERPRSKSTVAHASDSGAVVIELPVRRWINLRQLAEILMGEAKPEAVESEMVTVVNTFLPRPQNRAAVLERKTRALRHSIESSGGERLDLWSGVHLKPRKRNGRWVVASDELEAVLFASRLT